MRNRVLVWGLSNHRAGTEAVIYNYVTHAPGVMFDYLCYEAPESYADLFDGTGSRYFVIPIKIKHPVANWRALKRFMSEHASEYSAVWVNLNDISNIDILIQAKKHGIPRRIVHMHNSGLPDSFITKTFSKLNWNTCLQLATDRWACSKAAGDFLYGNLSYRIIPNAVDSEACAFDGGKRVAVRQQWGIEGKFVIGSVGRLVAQKNQRLLVRILPDIIARRENAVLMIVGEGELRDELERLSIENNVQDNVIFVGVQKDMQAYLSAFDVFAFPSLYEGLSLSLLEAQFNGLPCVVSDGVSQETFISRNVDVEPLKTSSCWVDALIRAARLNDCLIIDKAKSFTLNYLEQIAPTLF